MTPITPSTIEADAAETAAALQTPVAQAIVAELNARIKAAFPKLEPLEAEFVGLVPGWRTSEFWLHIFVSLGTVAASTAGFVPGKWAAACVVASGGFYAISRGLAKKGD